MNVWALTDMGLKRDSNQDTFLIDENLGLYIVADGMGGHKGGEVASAIAVETVQEVVGSERRSAINPRDLLMRAYSQASERIYSKSLENDGELRGMGTTMVLVLVQGNHLFIGNVGDSRCYLYRSSQMWQVTEDHSLVSEQLRAGLVSEDQVEKLLPKNVITRSVGYEREVLPDFIERKIAEGDSYLLCSDGLTGMVDDDGITQIISQSAPDQVPHNCVEMAKTNGGDDNITVMFLQVKG